MSKTNSLLQYRTNIAIKNLLYNSHILVYGKTEQPIPREIVPKAQIHSLKVCGGRNDKKYPLKIKPFKRISSPPILFQRSSALENFLFPGTNLVPKIPPPPVPTPQLFIDAIRHSLIQDPNKESDPRSSSIRPDQAKRYVQSVLVVLKSGGIKETQKAKISRRRQKHSVP